MYNRLISSPYRAWAAFAVAMLVLALALWALERKQYHLDLASTQATAARELELLGSLASEALRRRDYQQIESILADWGRANALLAHAHITAQNGVVLGTYTRADAATSTLSQSLPLVYSYQNQARLETTHDLALVMARQSALAQQLLGLWIGIALLIGSLVHQLLKRHQAETSLFAAKEQAEVTLHSIGDAVITTDHHGIVTYLNPIAEELTGWTLAEAQNLPLTSIFVVVNESTREPVDNPVRRCLQEGIIVGLANHTVLISRNGDERAIEDSAAPIRARDGHILGVVLVFHDVTSARATARQLSWYASHDTLTGLVNRREFEERVKRALAGSLGDGSHHTLMYIDLDQFKIVNDTCGHVAGDELLRRLSSILLGQTRNRDTLARLGGDEFGLLLEHCTPEQAERVAEHMRETIEQFHFLWERKTFEISASIGIVAINRDSGSLSQVLSAADMACYAAKERGRNRYHFYQESDADVMRRHGEMLWVSRLKQALREHQFVLFRQAIAPANPARTTHHYEVLLRLRNADGSLSEPGAFLPAAERYDLMHAIDRWVVTHLFATQGNTLRKMHAGSDPATMASINLSGASLSDVTFLDFVREMLAKYSINPRQICFEITETVAITHIDRALTFIDQFRKMGCHFALDDFGSGLSSFAYLKNLPVDFLKIDGSIVRNIINSPIDAAMLRAINEVGHVMGLKTVAEYVESQPLRQRLRELGVDYVQGYAIEMPHPLEPSANIVELRRPS